MVTTLVPEASIAPDALAYLVMVGDRVVGYTTPDTLVHVMLAKGERLVPVVAKADVPMLPPIERDESYERDYIMLPGGWEVQTKGKGSSFRIAGPDAKGEMDRWPVTDKYLQEALTDMAHAIRKALTPKPTPE